jgi:hypothetical protein
MPAFFFLAGAPGRAYWRATALLTSHMLGFVRGCCSDIGVRRAWLDLESRVNFSLHLSSTAMQKRDKAQRLALSSRLSHGPMRRADARARAFPHDPPADALPEVLGPPHIAHEQPSPPAAHSTTNLSVRCCHWPLCQPALVERRAMVRPNACISEIACVLVPAQRTLALRFTQPALSWAFSLL